MCILQMQSTWSARDDKESLEIELESARADVERFHAEIGAENERLKLDNAALRDELTILKKETEKVTSLLGVWDWEHKLDRDL
jgi:hypothetical protein